MSAEDLLAQIDRPDWMRHAACVGLPVAWFFPEQGEKPDRRAKAACAGCPVRQSCLEATLHEEAPHGRYTYGYRAGTIPRERQRMIRQRPELREAARDLEPCGTDAAYHRHFSRGESPCDRCREAHNLAGSFRRLERMARGSAA